ncbi:MAG: FHA domain-containing protein [Deltaproteobacteria bacterium]
MKVIITVTDAKNQRNLKTLSLNLSQGEISIGRVQSNIIVNHPLVSRQHARLRLSAEGSLVFEDLGSRNGSSVNGARTQFARLKAGDYFIIGAIKFLVNELEVSARELPVAHPPQITRSAGEWIKSMAQYKNIYGEPLNESSVTKK